MKRAKLLLIVVLMTMMMAVMCCAEAATYPMTMNNGNLVLVDARMGYALYVDRSSVAVQRYQSPDYQIAINIVGIRFSDDYWTKHNTYVGGPYKVSDVHSAVFRYNWARKAVMHQRRDGTWHYWNINKFNSHADGNPFVPYAAETAFVAAYNMRFYNNIKGYDGRRVINEGFYRTLGI